jgi:hypothetical protein
MGGLRWLAYRRCCKSSIIAAKALELNDDFAPHAYLTLPESGRCIKSDMSGVLIATEAQPRKK